MKWNGLVWLVVGWICTVVQGAPTRPNLVFLMADDQNTGSLGCYGQSDVQTPNIDQLSREGITFDNHYVSTAICMASRATVMSGMYEYKTGCNFKRGHLPQETWKQSYPVLLRQAGYRTAFAGKFGFDLSAGPDHKKLPQPAADFDQWAGGKGQTSYQTAKNPALAAYAAEYPHATLAYGAFGRDFIQEAAKGDQPFCLSISFKAPHRPAAADPRFNELYKGKRFRRPPNYGREHGAHFSEQSRRGRQYERFESWKYDTRYDEVMAVYHRQVHGIDVAVGMIRTALEEAGVAENTVVIYTSDNGFFCGAHGYGSKVLPYEESARVPLIVYDPRQANSGKAIRTDALTANVDFAPTLLKLAGVEGPPRVDGADLMKIYADPAAEIHEAIPLINVWGEAATHALAMVTREHKYIYWAYGADGCVPAEELYHTGNDPLELENRARNPEAKATLERMRKLYDQQLAEWEKSAVRDYGYPAYATRFSRNLPWSEKTGW